MIIPVEMDDVLVTFKTARSGVSVNLTGMVRNATKVILVLFNLITFILIFQDFFNFKKK